MTTNERMRLGDLLVKVGKITEDELGQALDQQSRTGKKIGEILVDQGYVTENDIIQVLEFQLGIPHINLSKHHIDPNIPKLITEKIAKRYTLIPIGKKNSTLTVAMSDPFNIFAIDDMKMATGLEIQPVICTKDDILNCIEKYYGKESAEKAIEDFKKQYTINNLQDLDEDTLNEINNAPAVRLVNSIIKQAVKSKASDIHIEPFEDIVRVRYRVDGDLQEIMTPTISTHSAMITRIKIMANMDIAEKRVPQDGRVEMNVDSHDIDLRISTLPTVFGEKVVLRLLDRSNFLLSKNRLGFTQKNLDRFDNIVKSPNGIILVTGPTGSGKTTTLYALLKELNKSNLNIITVEDPVEYRLDGINQVQVNNKTGLTFASGLKSILRQDPDIIMVGEIRDKETAELAVRAAITGHLVISTIHTNNAPATVTRLVDMGIEPYLISSSVVGIVAQRLVRKICDNCKTTYSPSITEQHILGISQDVMLQKGKGCSQCFSTGYKGRTAIYEIMTMGRKIRSLIESKSNMDILREEALSEGMISLRDNCKELVLDGTTTFEELMRVTYTTE